MRFQNFHLMILFRQKAVRKWVCLCVKHCCIIILCVLRWEKIYRQFLTTSIKGTILTVIKHSGRTTPPSHLYCNVCFCCCIHIYLFLFVLFFIYTSTLNSAHPPSLKQHHQSSLRPLWEHRKSLVCLLLSLSFCSLFWEEMRGSRNDRRAWFGSLFLCVCVRVCVLIEKTGFDMTTPHKDPWHTLTFNTHWLLSHTDPYHTESLIKQWPLLLPVRRHYLRPQLRNRNTSNIRTMMWSSGQHIQMCKVMNKHTYNL